MLERYKQYSTSLWQLQFRIHPHCCRFHYCISKVKVFTILFYYCEQLIRSKLFNYDNMIQWLHFTYYERDYIHIFQRHFRNLVHPSYKHDLVRFEIIIDNHNKISIPYNGIFEWFEINHIQWLKHMWCMGK